MSRIPNQIHGRPVVTIVAMDPAYSGPCGLAVGGVEPGSAATWWQGDVRSHECYRWLADAVLERTPPGTRAVLVAESTAFGPSVARKLGIAVGHVEGLLQDLNAILPDTRVDVGVATWRKWAWNGARRPPAGRAALKAAAVVRARKTFPALLADHQDAAEALLVLEWARAMHRAGKLVGP